MYPIAIIPTYKIANVMKDKGYLVFDLPPYNINLVGIRNDINPQDNRFDDYFYCFFKSSTTATEYNVIKGRGTTDPGKYYLTTPFSDYVKMTGAAIVKPGQYKGVYQLGWHGTGNFRHKALIQVRPITCYRDNNWNGLIDIDESKVSTGLYGLNFHRAHSSQEFEFVDNWSAGCQVVQNPRIFDQIIKACELQVANGLGNSFTYTLLKYSDFK
jgi:hypothetical protein